MSENTKYNCLYSVSVQKLVVSNICKMPVVLCVMDFGPYVVHI
jgi:hypothetical protein